MRELFVNKESSFSTFSYINISCGIDNNNILFAEI